MPETYLRTEESADAAALGWVREKIGLNLSISIPKQLATFTNPMCVPAGGRGLNLSLAYMTFLLSPPPAAGYAKLTRAGLRSPQKTVTMWCGTEHCILKQAKRRVRRSIMKMQSTIPKRTSHSDYDWIFKVACERIRNKLNYRPNVLLVLGSTFTMREARVYATALMKKSTQSTIPTFRKRICIC